MREWVSGDRLVEAAQLVAIDDAVEECVDILEHILRPTHESFCFVPMAEERTIVSAFSTNMSGGGVLPVCMACPAIFTQLMPPSIAAEFTEQHVRKNHPIEVQLHLHGQPWLPGDARLN